MNLDLTDVVTDPIFQDGTGTLFLRQVTETVSVQGLASQTVVDTPIQGSVQNAGAGRLVRSLDGGEMVQDTIEVYTTAQISPGYGTRSADIILWQGRKYLVQSVNDWGSWGTGWVCAVCSLDQVRP